MSMSASRHTSHLRQKAHRFSVMTEFSSTLHHRHLQFFLQTTDKKLQYFQFVYENLLHTVCNKTVLHATINYYLPDDAGTTANSR